MWTPPLTQKKINSFEPAKDKRKNRWTRAATWGGHQRLNQKLTGWKMSTTTYHPERSDWHDAVAPVAVGPGVPAGVLSFLQYEHLTGHVLLLIPDPAGEADKQIRKRGNLKCAVTHSVSNLRSDLYPDGADSLHALLAQVTGLSKQVHSTSLEVLVFIEVYLESKNTLKALVSQVQYFRYIITCFHVFFRALGVKKKTVVVPCDCAAQWQSGCLCCLEHLSETWSALEGRSMKSVSCF